MDSTFYDWKHVAYSGGKPNDFIKAPHCYKAFKAFNAWVGEDSVCWWFKPSAEMHALMNQIVLKSEPPKQPIILSEYMPAFFAGEGVYYGSVYKIAEERNISLSFTEHDSWDDVMAILHLFRGVNFPQEALSMPPLKFQCKAEKFAIEGFEYQYDIKAKLLHKKGCELIPTETEIYGFETLKSLK